MNLEKLITSQITMVVPKRTISISFFNGQVTDLAGAVTTNRTVVTDLKAQVELADNQALTLVDGISFTKVYKTFFIQSYTLTGLNRNITTGGDYIILDDLYYRIVRVNDNFKVGWVEVVGEESTNIDGA